MPYTPELPPPSRPFFPLILLYELRLSESAPPYLSLTLTHNLLYESRLDRSAT